MPLTREQRDRLARVLRWSRSNGWTRDVYPHTWRTSDGHTHVRFDTSDHELVVSQIKHPPACNVTLVPADSFDTVMRVLAALGHIPMPLGFPELEPPDPDPVIEVDEFDGPSSFAEAGQAFADLVDGRVMPEQAAEALSGLARQGLIVSVAYFDETVGSTPEMAGARS